jgi:uncharacterized protein
VSVQDQAVLDRAFVASRDESTTLRELRATIEHAAHLLPVQGPITVFVHHNTLHAFEHRPFDAGVKAGGRLFGCHAYLPEECYRHHLENGRIRLRDLEAVLLEDLGDEADRLVATFGTRYALRLAMLQFPLRSGQAPELRWVIAETDALRRFRDDVEPAVRSAMIDQTRHWVLRDLRNGGSLRDKPAKDVVASVVAQLEARSMEAWSERKWEAFVLNFLWRVCQNGVRLADGDTTVAAPAPPRPRRHRDLLFEATGEDADLLVHEVLIRFCSAFVDQGFADWALPDRESGLYRAFLKLYTQPQASPTRWLAGLQHEARRLAASEIGPLESIRESLGLLEVADDESADYITHALLALRGWAGMVRQMETGAEWMPYPAPPDSLVEFLAVRLILDRLAIRHVAREAFGREVPLHQVRETAAAKTRQQPPDGIDQRAFVIFQLAQFRGWKPEDLQHLSREQWVSLVHEIEAFPTLERRRVFHLAYELKYRNETLDALVTHSRRRNEETTSSAAGFRPAYQVVCCIDEREESFRRHLEEVDPQCETFGVAGFFGVAMYYRGLADAHFKPLCPVNIKPRHYVAEEPLYSSVQAERRRAEARRRIGRATHHAHRGTRTFLGGLVTGLFGALAAFPLVARVLFPRTTAQIRRLLGDMVRTPRTELRLERVEPDPGMAAGHLGFSIEEMAAIVEGGLRTLGLTRPELFSPLVVICGHGSASLNNPHEAAHDCGACGGGRGGPNARAFAQMANDPRIRSLLDARGLVIPAGVFFVGAYHNTCDDGMTWYDLDRVPLRHRPLFERTKGAIDEARKRSAHERCRRFESADVSLSSDDALRHVEARAEDLSQTRPEYGHATNALCFVGRRAWSRGLFLDRRAFLASYDPAQDDQRCSILGRLLQAVIPVCAGISLEYYFSFVDPTGYGCGTKLPHNITSLLGVMDGASSDLRPGLPWQMVEIHEPVRLLFVIETTPTAIRRIIDDNEAISRLVNGDWVQLALFDPETALVLRYVRGEFVPYEPESHELPVVRSSIDWYGGSRDHLGFAAIAPDHNTAVTNAVEPI